MKQVDAGDCGPVLFIGFEDTVQEENIHWNLNFTNGKFANFIFSIYIYIYISLYLCVEISQ